MTSASTVETARHIAEIPLPNCRYIAFDGGYAYVSSYAGAVEFDPEYRRGYVAKIDTVTMQVVDTCGVGYQPEEMAVVDGRLYVANSGGYMAPDYDLTVSVIDLATFEVCPGRLLRASVLDLGRRSLDGRGGAGAPAAAEQ